MDWCRSGTGPFGEVGTLGRVSLGSTFGGSSQLIPSNPSKTSSGMQAWPLGRIFTGGVFVRDAGSPPLGIVSDWFRFGTVPFGEARGTGRFFGVPTGFGTTTGSEVAIPSLLGFIGSGTFIGGGDLIYTLGPVGSGILHGGIWQDRFVGGFGSGLVEGDTGKKKSCTSVRYSMASSGSLLGVSLSYLSRRWVISLAIFLAVDGLCALKVAARSINVSSKGNFLWVSVLERNCRIRIHLEKWNEGNKD